MDETRRQSPHRARRRGCNRDAALATGVRVARAADPVKVGVLFPLTGNAAAAGQASKAAVEVAAEIVNNAHPELANLPLARTPGCRAWAARSSSSPSSTTRATRRSPSSRRCA